MFVDEPGGLPSREDMRSLSGLEFMQRVLDGRLPAAPIARTLGYHLHHVEEGRVAFRGAPGFDALNPMGSVHGGWYGVLLDSAMGCAAMTMLPVGQGYTTLEYKVNLVRGVPMGMMTECVSQVDHAGRSTMVAHGEIRGIEDGKLYATGSTTCIVLRG